jgi:PRTRC genetic system ThiF family protein
VFVDPDRVEEKNIGRQNFCPAEVGEYKAFSLARRFSLAFGLRIQALCGRLGEVRMEAPAGARRFFAGCVDTAEARREIAKRAQYGHWRSDWWLDGGNHEYSGQVYIGSRQHTAINLMGLCTDLPRPDVQAPDLLEDPEPISSVDETGLSCAELAAVDAQSLMINQAIAGWMAVYLSRMLITHDLDIMATYVDLVSGSVRSVPIERPSQEEE